MRRALAALAALGVALLGLPGPAYAQAWSHSEPLNDAVGFVFSPDPPPCGSRTPVHDRHNREFDIRSEAVSWDAHGIEMRLRISDLRTNRSAGATFAIRTDTATWLLTLATFPGEGVQAFLQRAPDPSTIHPDQCGGVLSDAGSQCAGITGGFSARTDLVSAVVPPACLKHPRRVQVGGQYYGQVGEVFYSDRWAPPGNHPGFYGPFGAQVRPS